MRALLYAVLFAGLSYALVHVWPGAEPSGTSDAGPLDSPLAGGGGRTEAGGGQPAERSHVTTRTDVRTYTVRGRTDVELLRALQAGGPRSGGDVFFGLTVTEMTFRYVRQPEADGCRLRDVQILLDVDTTLPTWSPPPDAPTALRARWDRFLDALTAHEARHADIAALSAQATLDAIGDLRGPSCEAAEAQARRLAETMRAESDAAQRRYDAETRHGAAQGAVWPQ